MKMKKLLTLLLAVLLLAGCAGNKPAGHSKRVRIPFC